LLTDTTCWTAGEAQCCSTVEDDPDMSFLTFPCTDYSKLNLKAPGKQGRTSAAWITGLVEFKRDGPPLGFMENVRAVDRKSFEVVLGTNFRVFWIDVSTSDVGIMSFRRDRVMAIIVNLKKAQQQQQQSHSFGGAPNGTVKVVCCKKSPR
jgi:hypothetical protein